MTEKLKNEFLYFSLRNPKFIIGFITVAVLVVIAIIGPFFSKYSPLEMSGPLSKPPSSQFWLGTTNLGQDVFSQLVHGMRASFVVGILSGTIATFIGLLVGFVAGYKGGWMDEVLMALTNIFLVIPTFALLIIISAFFSYRGIFFESLIIGFTAWSWIARCVRSQTLSLREREFVNLARINGMGVLRIISEEIAPNMLSYVFMVYIIQFGASIIVAAGLDFIGLGPTVGISLGLMANYAVKEGALMLGTWWWIIPPGLVITMMVGALYFTNTGLDEVFNPKLREK
ncbi:MAG: ABC transporter permease [Chitinivibrionales bacterium]|nr:ABC transporter permease [Chitinivibrionales bacterium]